MDIRNASKAQEIKQLLLEKLREEQAFWSYSPDTISSDKIDDDQLIALTMRYLDLPEIAMLFRIYSLRKSNMPGRIYLSPKESICTHLTDSSHGIISKPSAPIHI